MNSTIRVLIENRTGEHSRTEPMADYMDASTIPTNAQPKTSPMLATKTAPGLGITAIGTAVVLSAGKQASNIALASVGMLTGDSLKQNRVNTAIKMSSYAAGLLTFNPVIIAGVAISAGGEAISYGIGEAERKKWEAVKIQNEKQYRDILIGSEGRHR